MACDARWLHEAIIAAHMERQAGLLLRIKHARAFFPVAR